MEASTGVLAVDEAEAEVVVELISWLGFDESSWGTRRESAGGEEESPSGLTMQPLDEV